MYAWFWRTLPGRWPGKLLATLAALGVVIAILFVVVFPWLEPKLPFNDVTVDEPIYVVTPTPAPSLS
ncbi:MAG: hypothetical protein F2911_11115 [Actinobacteria bacterium]|uniref:Unannotated protein n=1 Tax=freshwater metagenome TaxID=449393 RepID=A0A6J7SFD4_9ZZZZ|nr:hypothetical protein [Actinomycetota bacterium]